MTTMQKTAVILFFTVCMLVGGFILSHRERSPRVEDAHVPISE